MVCASCRAVLPDAARFCASCGCPAGSDAMTMGASQATELSPGGLTRPHASGGRETAVERLAHLVRFDQSRALWTGRAARQPLPHHRPSRPRRDGGSLSGGRLRLGQPVALKLLPEALRHDPVRLAQFHNEVRTARQVSHPNVCRVYDIGEADGLLYLSMEYVDGEDLASSLRRIGRFPEDKAADIARQLCAGLAAAHQRGVVHRDLKPANVMLDGAGRVRVMDFGLAAIGRVEDVRAGTPAYMAPEQLLGPRGHRAAATSSRWAS